MSKSPYKRCSLRLQNFEICYMNIFNIFRILLFASHSAICIASCCLHRILLSECEFSNQDAKNGILIGLYLY